MKFAVLAFGAAALFLAACGDGPSESRFAAAIDKSLEGRFECMGIQGGGAVRWPLRLNRGGFGQGPVHPILVAMQKAGYVTITPERQARGFITQVVDVIEPTAEAKTWWDNARGFCVGRRGVDSVVRWTEPGQGPGTPVQVEYRWKLKDVPKWAQRPEFQQLPGMGAPVDARTSLIKASDGWRVGA